MAVATGERSVTFANRDDHHTVSDVISASTTHANALHAAGRFVEAEIHFVESERQQRKSQPEYSFLFSLQGYEYCDLLLAKNDYAEAHKRATQTLEWFEQEYPLLSRALDVLTLGRARLGLVLEDIGGRGTTSNERDEVRVARGRLDDAVEALRGAAQMQYLPRGLLARAVFLRSVADWDGATRDLDEVEEVAEPGPMKLFLCDMTIERARLAFAKIEAFAPLNGLIDDSPRKPAEPEAAEATRLKEGAAKQLAIAADYVKTCGYHRRDEELAELQAVLRGEREFADLPPRV
jgi:tetratricopeptide (TPR) repeat protein